VSGRPALLWFRLDLRLADNDALARALAAGGAVIPVFLWTPEEEAPWAPGAASRWWLHNSLVELQAALGKCGSKLIVHRGPAQAVLGNLAAESGAHAVFWNRRYEPAVMARDRELERGLSECGLVVESCPGNLVFEPWAVRNSNGKQFQVFTAFWRTWLNRAKPEEPKRAPAQIPAPPRWPASLEIAELELEPKIDWAAGLRQAWHPGEAGAIRQLDAFLAGPMYAYSADRERPSRHGTSRLSPHLHFGEISVRQIWHAVWKAYGANPQAAEPYLREIAWREFAHHLVFHYPATPQEPLRREFRSFPWRMDADGLKAWTRGKTGYPLVDAAMRELWNTGWMHNRVRMVTASFLVKHLLIPWQEGAAWFWDTLVDADLANNTLGWQWCAGCGADAAPYFRIFNPVVQGEKFDPEGEYVRRWIPELARVPDEWIHKPWKAPGRLLAQAGVELGNNYPLPIVAHEAARERALAALAIMRGNQRS
jgi:deoxyribodipyrimidine photo-lyase